MRVLPLGALSSVSFAALTLGLAAPAFAQDAAAQPGAAAQEQCTPSSPTYDRTTGTCAQAPEGGANPDSNVPAGTVVTNADGSETAVTTAAPNSGPEAEVDQNIIVTGSRIRRPNLDSPVPVATINQEEFFETGQVTIGETLNELPQLRTTVGQQNGINVGLGSVGLNLLDLRGLGTQRTLVLVNGRRHVGSDIFGNATSPDTNTIPTSLIQRTDVVTGGNSAIYGSDAIAGVVNFVLRRNFSGIEARAQAGISEYEDANSYFVSLTAGHNFADGRGNVAIAAEYARQDEYFGNVRPNLARQDGFLVVDTDPAGTPNGSDGVFDRQYFRDIRSATISNTGTINFGSNANFNCGVDPLGGFYTCPFIFQPDGTLVAQSGQRVGIAPFGSFIGGNGENFRGGDQLQLAPNLDRYVINLIGHFTISDAFEPFIEAKYARTEVVGAGNSGPAFIISAGNAGDVRQTPRLDNPFLTPQARALITQRLLATNLSPGTVSTNPGATLTAAQVAAINNGSFRLRIQENFTGLGKRVQVTNRDTYRIVGGVRGTFNEDWGYEASVNYGEFREDQTLLGNYNRQRFLLAADAARDPATGQIVCRSKFDPAARTGLSTAGATLTAAERQAILNADIAACVPINIFGGQFTPEQVAYIVQPTTAQGKIRQFVANAFLSGDTSQLFELPAGPIGFAVGTEYRRETNAFAADDIVRLGYTFFNPVADIDAPAFEVKEAFGEVRIPLLKGVFGFEDLSVNGALRYADYSGATGTVLAYNAGVEWTPFRDLRLRGNYSRAVRAPLIAEQFAQQVSGFATVTDPCSLRNRGSGAATRAANCAALGVPAAYDFVYPGSLVARFGGNPDLTEEKSNSWTIGGVLSPRVIPGLSISMDYYDIEVKNVISAVSAQNILNLCVDQATIENPFCALFTRNTGPGPGPQGEEVGRVLEGSLLVSTLNYASLRDRGVDVEVNYRRQLAGIGTLDLRANYTHLLQRSAFQNPADPNFENSFLRELNDPQDEALFRANLKSGRLDLTYGVRFIGKQYLNTFEDYNFINDQNPQNADYADVKFYPNVFYHNARVGFDVTKQIEAYAGVDNIFGKDPPFGLTGIGTGSGIYDNRGRFFYGGLKARF
jgi:outer membrane receptor protein involved in Fe transport